jgi:ATP-dependent Clp protease ATP-binding subunit ClpC
VQLLGYPEMTAFAQERDSAKQQLVTAIVRRFTFDREFAEQCAHLSDLRLRRVDVLLRVLQGDRLLPVPLRVSAVVHKPLEATAEKKSVRVLIPRLGESHLLQRVEDVDAFVEEIVRHRLFMARAEQLLALGYDGDEFVDSVTVSFREKYQDNPQSDPDRRVTTPAPQVLQESCRDLLQDARHGVIERAFLREQLVETVEQILTAKRHASVLLVGPKGAGKTAIAYELAHRVAAAASSDLLFGYEFWQTSGARIVAGMRYLGEWQNRVKLLIDSLRSRCAVLHIADLNELFAATQGDEYSADLSAYLATAMESDALVLLCEATAEDVARAEKNHPAFIRALRRVSVSPLSGSDAHGALELVAGRIAKQHNIKFAADSLRKVFELCERFGDGTALPGSAVSLLQSVAVESVAGSAQRSERAIVSAPTIMQAFSRRTGFPPALIDASLSLDPASVDRALSERVVGQPEALGLLRDLVVTLKTAMTDPARPLGSFLFLGPTGVGKTESALALAAYLFGDDKRVLRFDMSEFSAPGSATRLISDAPGVHSSLTRRVREQPFAVVLLDEIEKADSSVHDLLLQILGEGRLTDATGHTVSFRNTVVILTSNLGAETASRSLGFEALGRASDVATHYTAAAAKFFRPELLNRIDHVVPFQSLDVASVARIAKNALDRALSREGLQRRQIRVRYDDSVVAQLVRLGFDPQFGARPLKRAIERWVVGPIARVLAARAMTALRELELVVRGEGIALAPTSSSEVSALGELAVQDELARRARLSKVDRLTLSFAPLEHAGGARAGWLADQYAQWCTAHGSHALVTSIEHGVVQLLVEGPIASLLRHEIGVHEFEAGQSVARVSVSVGDTKSDAVRLYTSAPEESVWDMATELESAGAWQKGLSRVLLDRLVLARCAVLGA